MLGNKNNNNSFEYISLRDAAKFCNYSQEYLSLRARRGKLKSVKLGRNWVTTKEWLVEYTDKVEEYNDLINNKNEKAGRFIKEKIVKDQIIHSPPDNLPIIRYPKFRFNLGTLRFGFAAVLLLTLIVAVVYFEQESLIRSYNDFIPYIEEISRIRNFFIKNVTQNAIELSRAIERLSDDFLVATINHQNTIKSLSNVFEEYGQWLKGQISEIWFENIAR